MTRIIHVRHLPWFSALKGLRSSKPKAVEVGRMSSTTQILIWLSSTLACRTAWAASSLLGCCGTRDFVAQQRIRVEHEAHLKSGIAEDAIRFTDALKSKLLVVWSENCFAACPAGRAGTHQRLATVFQIEAASAAPASGGKMSGFYVYFTGNNSPHNKARHNAPPQRYRSHHAGQAAHRRPRLRATAGGRKRSRHSTQTSKAASIGGLVHLIRCTSI